MLNIIQPDIWLRRKTRPIAAAISPVVMALSSQRDTARTKIAAIMKPLTMATVTRTRVMARVSVCTALRKCAMPSRT